MCRACWRFTPSDSTSVAISRSYRSSACSPAGGAWSEPGERLGPAVLVRAGRGGDPVPVGGQPVVGFDGGADLRGQVLDGVGEVGEDDHLALVADLLLGDSFGRRRRLRSRRERRVSATSFGSLSQASTWTLSCSRCSRSRSAITAARSSSTSVVGGVDGRCPRHRRRPRGTHPCRPRRTRTIRAAHHR